MLHIQDFLAAQPGLSINILRSFIRSNRRDAIGSRLLDLPNLFQFLLQVIFRDIKRRSEAPGLGVIFKAGIKIGILPVKQIRQHHRQQIAPALAQLARVDIDRIAQFSGRLLHGQDFGAAYLSVAVQHIGNRAVGNARQLGNILDGRQKTPSLPERAAALSV